MEDLPGKLWEERWRLLTWVVPALGLVLFAHKAVLPLASHLAEARAQVASMRENTYEAAWLDSTQNALRGEVETLKAFQAGRLAALNRDAGPQAAVDRLRALAQKNGFEVVKTTPSIVKQDSLRVLKIKIEGFAAYGGLLSLFRTLEAGNPDLYLEEMIIRRGGERARGRLEAHLVLHAYGEKGSPP